jgi:hypothetical protein
MSLNRDYAEMLSALSDEGAEFMIVGAYAMAAHGVPRATGDLDIWVRCSRSNAVRVMRALRHFGAPLFDLTEQDLARGGTVLQIGQPPSRIDILTSIDGVTFGRAWAGRLTGRIEGIDVAIIGHEALLRNKRAAARPKDLVDVGILEAASRATRIPRSRARRHH